MKKILLNPFLSLLIISLIFISCKKDHKEDPFASSFSWLYVNTSYTANIDSAYISSMSSSGSMIIAGMGNSILYPGISAHITLSSLDPGLYWFDTLHRNAFLYVDASGDILDGTAGYLKITSYANNMVSGEFVVTLTNLGNINRHIAGNFVNVPVRP